ncbi:ATP-binding protein [Candidatus Nasuia deltocephalinicola]|uniref:ATP-binding protein n=1 Tax=Candidatus Nasuia deltocephalincola TaxID=1160784 RepID=UPI00216ACAB7|nr:ATP-binding protein [Candidatus Nasuia deltocephalinicola]
MYKIKKRNKIYYKIYNKLKINNKKVSIISSSLGVDSNLNYKEIKKINKNIKIININHNLNKKEKKKKKIKKKNLIKKKIKKFKNIKKYLRIKIYKKIKKIIKKKKIRNIWIFQNKNEVIENFIIQIILKKKFLKIKNDKNKINFKKIKPILKIKKKYIKKLTIKKKYYFLEEKENIKFKNKRNKIRINIINNLKLNIKNFLKNIIKFIYKK